MKKDLLIFALGGSIGWIAGEAMVSQDKSTMKKKGLIFARSALAGVVMSSSLGGLTALTYDSNSIEKATYTDGIAYAKDQIGLLEKFDRHDELIAQTVKNYLLLSKSLEKLDNSSQEPSVCLMTVSDIHSRDVAPLLKAIIKTSCVDAVLDAGDITEWGAAFESGAFAELGNLGVNYYVVKGNHDSPQTMEELIAIPNVTVLDGQVVDIKGLRITGIGDSDYTPDDMISGQGDRPRIDDKIGQRFKAVADSNLPDIAIVHKPQAAKAVQGNARMVISGHSHTCAPRLDVLDSGTLNYNIGTTGGAHLRTFNNKCSSSVSEESGQPQTFSIIYFNVDGKPYAVDEFTLSGLQPNGKLDLQVTRRLVKCENQCAKPG